MAYMDDLLRELEARNLTGKIYNAGSSSSQSSNSTQKKKKKDYTEELLTILSEDAKKNGVKLELSDYGTISADSFKAPMDDIAPVKTTVKKSEEADDGLLDFFQKGALGEIDLRKNFRDGYQFGDILKTGGHVAGQVGKAILGTAGDVGLGVAKGFASSAEGIADLASYGIAAGLDALGKDDTAERWRKNASENTVEEWTKGADEYLNRYSMAGRTTDAISQGIGQIGSIIATGGFGKAAGLGAKAVTALTTGTMGLSGAGAGMGEAYRGGATDEEAATYGLIAGASDALTELLFGGLGKAVGAVGLSTGLSSADDLLAKKVSGLFTNQIAKNFAEYGIKAGAEGFEEVLAGTAQAIGKKITYMKEEELSEILKDENLLEQFVVGAAASGLMQSGMIPGMTEGSLKEANAEGRDFITGLNQTEQTVIDKEVAKRVAAEEEKSGAKLTKKEIGKIEKTVQEDMDKGYISIDTIEEALGGETYTNYKKVVDAEEKMQREYDELGKKEKYTLADDARYKELGERLKYVREKGAKNELRKRLDDQVSGMVKDSRLVESFNERARRGQKFEADLEQYTDEKQRAIVQKAVESGILNNTNRTREFVNMVSKIAADKDITFDFANNAKLKESGFAVEGKTVNGFVTKDGITVNIQSAKALNSVVGHEITHVLEGTELYTELQTAAIEYAKTKGDYQGRYDALVKVYESVEGANIDAELTADLVGDYLFTDSDFISNLSTNHRNVFQKIYDEVKYLLKVATAGSKEARELEKVKRAFEKAYREGGNKTDTTAVTEDMAGDVYEDSAGGDGSRASGGTKYSLVEDQKTVDFLENQEHVTTYKAMALIDGKLYPPMASQTYVEEEYTTKSGEKKTRRVRKLKNPSVLGRWQQAEERTDIAEKTFDPKKGYSSFDLLKSNGKTTGGVAYNPYEHTSNIVLNDQFSEAYQRPELVTVEYEIPVSELTSGYKAQYAKDPVGLTDWKAGGVAQKLQHGHRDVYLTRWSKPVRVLSDAEVAQKYKEILDKEEGISVPWNVVTASLREELEKIGVPIDYSDIKAGSTVRSFEAAVRGDYEKPKKAKKAAKYSLAADSEGRQLSAEQREYFKDSKIVDQNGNLKVMYHGSNAQFTVFDKSKAKSSGLYGKGFYFTDSSSHAGTYGNQYEVYLDIRNPLQDGAATVTRSQVRRYLEAIAENEDYSIENYGTYDIDKVLDVVIGKNKSDDAFKVIQDINITAVGDMVEAAELFNLVNGTDFDGIVVPTETIAFRSEQIKSVDNVKPTADPDIRYSLSEYSEEEKKAHNAAALEHFGKTYRWAETGYLLLDGARLDLSGKRFGAPGGYRTVDHRDIADALGADYGDGSYSGALMQFMSEGNIRISPESNGINLSVLPTKAQESSLSAFISSVRGEVLLDIDDYEGDTVLSIEYPKYTHANKVLADIRAWFESGATPEVEGGSVFRRSLSAVGEERYAFGNYNVYGRDIALEEDIAPVRQDIAPATVSKNATVAAYEEPLEEESPFAEVDRLTEQLEEMERQYEATFAADEYEKAEALLAEMATVAVRIRELENQLDADVQERLASMEDADAPAAIGEAPYSESTDTVTLPKKMVQDITRDARKALGFSAKQVPEMRTLVEKFSQGEIDSEQLHDEIAERFGTITETGTDEDVAEVKRELRRKPINVADDIKSSFADYTASVMRPNFGKIRFSNAKNADGVDTAYDELSDKYPGFFPKDIIQPADQLQRIIEVANMDSNTESQTELGEQFLDEVTDSIVRSVNEYKAEQRLKMSEQNAFESFNSLMRDADRYAPALEDDIAPVRADVAVESETPAETIMDKDSFFSKRAAELYDEIRNLKKGVKASPALGHLLDHGYEWRTIKTALLNIRDWPSRRVDFNSAAESVAREMIYSEYEDYAYEMSEAQESAPAAKQPIKNVKERLEAKLFNLQTELKRNQQLREESNAEYEQEIARLQTEYYERQNKNTKKANDILRRMERQRRLQSDEDARYAKHISDLEEQVAKAAEELRTGESKEAQRAMRQELHARFIDKVRTKFTEKGYDMDEVFKNAKDLSTFATVDNTPQRVMEKALGYKEGQILADLTVNQVAANETKGIRWLNSYTDRRDGLLAQISKQYSIKPGSKESAAAQMYAEGFYVNGKDEIVAYGDSELAQDFPDAKVQANIKGLARDPRIRQIYDATLAMINESRARNAYPEIQKLDNYFLHFRAMDDTFSRLGIPFNPNDIRAKDLPTDLNGVTSDLKPGQPYFASAMHRKGKRTSFDLLGGLERYLTSAKGQIYHIDDIQNHRALRNYIADTFGQAKGLEGLDALTEEEAQEHIEKVYDGHLSTFAKFLNEEANVIAGKTALTDRAVEGVIGRRGMTFFDTLNRQVGANMVGFNVSSALTNFIAPVQAFAKTNKAAFVKGFAQTVANRVGSIAGKTDGFAENNPTMIRRQGADRFYRTPWQKAGDLGYALMGGIDSFSTEVIVRGKYNELVSKGMGAEQAVIEADKWTSRLMGDRSLGQQPQIFNSKTWGLVTKFQLEVRNQLDSMFYDTIQEAKVSNEDIQNAKLRNAKTAAQVTSTIVQLAVVSHLFGKAFEAVAGYNPAFDIIEAIIKAFGWDDEEDSEDTVLDNLGQGFMSLLEDMPYYSVLSGTGRIPVSSALPIGQAIKGEDKYGNEKSRWETIAETAPYWLLPGGYGQIKKTTQGLGMFDDDLPIAGSYTDSGNLRYPVEDTLGNRVQAAIFGQYASSNARDYFDNERQSLKKNQIQELVDVDIPIREYWDYREGLNEQETLADKFDYIAGLDLPIDKKNILINNVVDRKEAVDLTDYHDYADYEEFDFAAKNPEKYDFLQSVGVSVGEYNSFDDDTKDAYNWAYQNPEKYTLSRAVSDDVAVYRQYTKALNDISADKDADGKSISGSRKAKVIQYLNGLDADYYSKLILFKMEYNADDTYNNEIIEYLNGRNDISFEEEVTILRELGFTVTADGTVRW